MGGRGFGKTVIGEQESRADLTPFLKICLRAVITLLLIAANTSVLAQMPWELPDNPFDDLVRNGIVVPLNTDEKMLVEKLGQPISIERTNC